MQFFPYEKFSLETTKSKQEVLEIIRKDLVKPSYNMDKIDPRINHFSGKVEADKFKVFQLVHWAPKGTVWFCPVLHGKLAAKGNGSRVEVYVYPKDWLFAIVFLVVMTYFGLFSGQPLLLLIPLVMYYLMLHYIEPTKARLLNLLEAVKVEQKMT